MDTDVRFREFQAGDEAAFWKLNEEWITRHFALEPKDEIVLRDPQTSIIDQGGRVFLAVVEDETVGCCALLAIGEGQFEVGKMTVAEKARRSGIGRRMLGWVIEEARASGATRLYLETNWKLPNAIRLYELAGFRHLPPERVKASPYARANVYMELNLSAENLTAT